eukprot:scaffold13993_cov51-Attheya_sp.AAC.2
MPGRSPFEKAFVSFNPRKIHFFSAIDRNITKGWWKPRNQIQWDKPREYDKRAPNTQDKSVPPATVDQGNPASPFVVDGGTLSTTFVSLRKLLISARDEVALEALRMGGSSMVSSPGLLSRARMAKSADTKVSPRVLPTAASSSDWLICQGE